MNKSTSDGGSAQLRLFACIPVFSTRLVREGTITHPERPRLRTPADVGRLLQDYFRDKDREEMIVVLLDAALQVIGLARISQGGLRSTVVEPAQVMKAAILANAGSVVLAHNHPSGNMEPSREDVQVTRQLVEAGKLMGVPVLDHLIVTDAGYTSLAERGLVG